MPIDSVYDFFVEHLNIYDHPQFSAWPAERQLIHIGKEFFTVAEFHYEALASADKADDKAVEAALTRLMQKYIEPLTKTGRPGVDFLASFLLTQAPAKLTELLASAVQNRMGS